MIFLINLYENEMNTFDCDYVHDCKSHLFRNKWLEFSRQGLAKKKKKLSDFRLK